MQDVLNFQNKVEADGIRLQGEVKVELGIIKDELQKEENKRREYDSNLILEVNTFLH